MLFNEALAWRGAMSPIKMFEYMAAGRAIVTADLSVIREVLNEKNAVFCKPDNVDDWKLEIEELLADGIRRVELGKQAQGDVQKFTWLARAKKILLGM